MNWQDSDKDGWYKAKSYLGKRKIGSSREPCSLISWKVEEASVSHPATHREKELKNILCIWFESFFMNAAFGKESYQHSVLTTESFYILTSDRLLKDNHKGLFWKAYTMKYLYKMLMLERIKKFVFCRRQRTHLFRKIQVISLVALASA